jgi:ribosomal protein L11 methyltransferase
MAWLQLHLVAARPRVETVEDALLALGALSVTLGDNQDVPILEPGVGETPLWEEVALSALFDEFADSGHISEALRGMLAEALPELRWERVEDRAWEREWLQHFAPVCFGGHFWVCPGGATVDDPQAIVMQLDPGLAFGTGTHPTTALCLEWLAAQPPRGRIGIDYGCGSGILAVAALLLGATRMHAVDIDPQAIIASRDNGERNGLGEPQLLVGEPSALDQDQAVDLLLANILAGPLIELAPRFATLTRPGAQAILSGVLDTQVDAVCAAYAPWFALQRTVLREQWCRIDLQRTDAGAPGHGAAAP